VTNDFDGRHVVVTGGLGFIGSALARRLVDLDARVTIVDSLIPEYGGNRANIADIEDRVRVDVSDVRDRAGLRDVVAGCDFLFNLAGQTSHLDSMTDPFTDLDINCVAQLSILEACRAWNPDVKIVFASTRQLYGKPDYSPTDEAHLLRPVDVNGVNKMAGEWYHILYNNVYGLRAAALRLTNTYGPAMRIKDARQTFLGIWVRRLLENRPIEVWGGGQLRDFTYVDDAVEAFLLAARDPAADGEVFNLGGEGVISLRDLAELLIEVAGGGEVVLRDFPEERKRIDIGDYYADWSKIRRVLGWEPTVSIRDGLQRTIEYYRTRLAAYL
jgi:nucleoside-diphosphate-sugar epimerase